MARAQGMSGAGQSEHGRMAGAPEGAAASLSASQSGELHHEKSY